MLSLVVVLVGFVAFSYLSGTGWSPFPRGERPAAVGTTGTISVETARERGADMGARLFGSDSGQTAPGAIRPFLLEKLRST